MVFAAGFRHALRPVCHERAAHQFL